MKDRKFIFGFFIFFLFIAFCFSALFMGEGAFVILSRYYSGDIRLTGFTEASLILTVWMSVVYCALFVPVITVVLVFEVLKGKNVSKVLTFIIMSLGCIDLIYSTFGLREYWKDYLPAEIIIVSLFIICSALWFVKLYKTRNDSIIQPPTL